MKRWRYIATAHYIEDGERKSQEFVQEYDRAHGQMQSYYPAAYRAMRLVENGLGHVDYRWEVVDA